MLNRLNEYRQQFAFYGFTMCPLTDAELILCHHAKLTASDVYYIGCDINSGLSFEDSLATNLLE